MIQLSYRYDVGKATTRSDALNALQYKAPGDQTGLVKGRVCVKIVSKDVKRSRRPLPSAVSEPTVPPLGFETECQDLRSSG